MSSNTFFLFEYASCGAFPQLEPSITIEGVAMFKTLLRGFESIGSRIATFIDERIPFFPVYPKVRTSESLFDDYLEYSDFSLCIAPETDLILYGFIKRLEKSNSGNLGSDSNSVLKTTDKYKTYKELNGIYSPKTEIFKGKTKLDFPLVAKPRDGVSGEGITLVKDEKDLENVQEGYLLQEYIEGKACSASLLIGDDINILSFNSQEMKDFRYTGAKVPINVDDKEEIFKAVESFPGLFGYVGVDFVLNDNVCIMEINPRPTTPIVALNDVYGINISELILKNYYKEDLGEITARKNIWMKKVQKELSKAFIQFEDYSIVLEEFN